MEETGIPIGEAREENNSETGAGEQRGGHRRHRHRNRRPQQQQRTGNQAEASLNLSELRELAELIEEHGFTDFEFENEKIRVRMRKEQAPQFVHAPVAPQPVSVAHAAPVQTSAPQTSAQAAPNQTSAANEPQASEDENLHKITSPIVGTFYRSPSPEADPFIKIGSQVTPETTVCIVEAMKLMNEIPAETSGEIVKIYVENGQPVEYGQPLFGVKK